MNTFYEILGVSRNATTLEIQAAYRKRCLETHPDKGGNEIDFLNVRKGYKILSDTTKRAQYDKWILLKEKEELEREELLNSEKQTSYNDVDSQPTSINETTNKFSFINYFWVIIMAIISIIIISTIYNENQESSYNKVSTKHFDTRPKQIINQEVYITDSKGLYRKLAENISTIGTYDDFLNELQNSYITEWYFEKAKSLNIGINTRRDFDRLFINEPRYKQPIKDGRWLYEILSEHIHTTDTYDEFLEELKNSFIAEWYYEKAKELNVGIYSREQFDKLFANDIK